MKKRNKTIIFIIIIWVSITITDFTLSQHNKGPIFAIPIKVHKDGGTTEYYGLGYKVIKYRMLQNGKNETVFGFWSLTYEN